MKYALWETVERLRKNEAHKIEESIRWILYTVSLRDAVVPQAEYGLRLPPKGLADLVAETWKALTGEELGSKMQQELVGYVKEGQRYSVIGAIVSEGVWLLLSKQIVDKK